MDLRLTLNIVKVTKFSAKKYVTFTGQTDGVVFLITPCWRKEMGLFDVIKSEALKLSPQLALAVGLPYRMAYFKEREWAHRHTTTQGPSNAAPRSAKPSSDPSAPGPCCERCGHCGATAAAPGPPAANGCGPWLAKPLPRRRWHA